MQNQLEIVILEAILIASGIVDFTSYCKRKVVKSTEMNIDVEDDTTKENWYTEYNCVV